MSNSQPNLAALEAAGHPKSSYADSPLTNKDLIGTISINDEEKHLQSTSDTAMMEADHEGKKDIAIDGAQGEEAMADAKTVQTSASVAAAAQGTRNRFAAGMSEAAMQLPVGDVGTKLPTHNARSQWRATEHVEGTSPGRLLRLIASQRRKAVESTNSSASSSVRWESIIASNYRTAQRSTAMECSPRYVDHGTKVVYSEPDERMGWMNEMDSEAVRSRLTRHVQRKRSFMASKVAGLRRTYRTYDRQWRAHCNRLDRIGEGHDGARRVVSFSGSGPGTPMHPPSFLQNDRSGEEGGDRADASIATSSARTAPAEVSAAGILVQSVLEGQQHHATAFVNSASTVASSAISINPSKENAQAVTSFDDAPSAGGLLASATATAMTRANRRNTQGSGGLAGFGDAVRSEAEFLEILATLESADMQDPSMRAARTTAVEPDMILSSVDSHSSGGIGPRKGPRIEAIKYVNGGAGQRGGSLHARDSCRQRRSDYVGRESLKRSYDDDNGFVADPSAFYLSDFDPDVWSDDEKATFARRYALFPKQFGRIASSLPNKTARQCVSYYYLTKKLYGHDYKTLLASRNRDRRRKTKLVKPKKGRGSALMADLKAAAPAADEDAGTGAGEEVLEAPTERPRSRLEGVGEEEAPETLTEKPRNRQTTSSYWSVAERNDFLQSLAVFGKDWEAIALTLTSKSAAQARNYFSRNARDADFADAVEMARKNEGRPLEERREAVKLLFQRPTTGDDQRRVEQSQRPRDPLPLDARGPTIDIIQAATTGAESNAGEVMRGLDISSLLNADPDSNGGNNSMRRASKQVYWFDRFLTSEHQGVRSDGAAEQLKSAMPTSSTPLRPPPLLPPPPSSSSSSSSHHYHD